MLTTAIVLIFISAVLHVSWNVLLKSAEDPLDVSTKAMGVGVFLLTPFIVFYWISLGTPAISPYAVLFGLLSGLAELGYFVFLSYAYRHGELSVVYPVARGSAPVLSFFFGLLFLQEDVRSLQIIGVLFLILGIWLVRGVKIKGKKGMIPALLTGVFIATYTVIDKVGLRYSDPVIFGELKYFFTALCLITYMPFKKAFLHTNSASNKTSWRKIVIIGVMIIVTYQLVLFALNIAPVALVSPLRESASVIVTAWGIWKLKEREGLYSKITGVVLIFVGVVLLAI